MTGKLISHYRILEELGRGGMGVVYKAQDTKLNRTIALKFLPTDLTHDPEAVNRFIHEAQAASALDHANICTIHEIGEITAGQPGEGQKFIVMAYYPGETLQEIIKRGPLPLEEALNIAMQVAQGLERAHEAHITHRDIKPSNLIITQRGEAKIIDFGLAKLAGRAQLTKIGAIAGTVAYMSPEQAQREEIDHRTDIWSLGVVFYEMLLGRLPFQGAYEAALMYAIVNEEPPPLHDFRPELPSNLQVILSRALAKNREERYQSVRKMLDDCRSFKARGFVKPDREAKAKIAYVPECENDVLISFAAVDDKPLSEGQEGWISNFHNALEVRLEQLLGADTKIWRDDKQQTKDASKETSDIQLPKTAVMVPIVSPQYVKTMRCLQEIKEFCQTIGQEEGLWIDDLARIFKAVKTPVPYASQPEELRVLPDYEFYQFDPASGRPQEFRPEFGEEAKRNYWAKLEDMAYDICQLLETIKNRKLGVEQVKSGPQATVIYPVIYLAETTLDLNNQRDKIKRQLLERGCIILPNKPLPLHAKELKEQVRTDLERCTLSIHIIGENYGVVPEGETRSIVEIQHELATGRSRDAAFSRLIWLPPGLHAQDERQQRLIEALKKQTLAQRGTDLLQTSLVELKTYILDKLSQKPQANGKGAIATSDLIRIYLQCDRRDLEATGPLEAYLFDQGFEVKLPAFDGSASDVFEAHKENLLLCDATIIYYGHATDSWLSTKFADLQKVAGYGRTKPMKAKAIYIAAPETSHKQRFRTREAITLKHFAEFSPEVLAPFLETMHN